MKLVMKGRERLGHLAGATKKPPEEDLLYQKWDFEDSVAILWLIISMELKGTISRHLDKETAFSGF